MKILIIDDHRMVRDGLRTMLSTQSDRYQFAIKEAESGEKAIELAKKNSFDIILVDYQLRDGISGAETVEMIKKFKPESNFLVLSNYDEQVYISNMVKAGVKGYVLKDISPVELVKAIETILGGNRYFAGEISDKLMNINESKNNFRAPKQKIALTKRQVQILKLIASGLTNEAIGVKLGLAKRTVDTHRQNLMARFEVRNAAALIKRAVELSII